MWKTAFLFSLITGCLLSRSSAKGGQHVKCDDPFQNFSLTSDVDKVVINCPNDKKWQKLQVYVAAEKGKMISLNIQSIVQFDGKTDRFRLLGADKKTVIHEGLVDSKRWMPIGEGAVTFVFEKSGSSSAAVDVEIRQVCGSSFEGDTFFSPILPNKATNNVVTQCIFNITKPSLIDFETFYLSKDSSFEFLKGVDGEFKGPFTSKPDHIFIGNKFDFLLKLKVNDVKQNVSFSMTPLTEKVCGKPMIALGEKPQGISVIGTDNQMIKCVWLIQSQKDQKIQVQVEAATLKDATDIVSIIDSGRLVGKPLMQLTALHPTSSLMISSDRYLVVMLTSTNFNTDSLKINFNAVKSGGYLYHNGTMSTDSTGDFILSTDSNSSIHVDFSSLGKLSGNSKIEVYLDEVAPMPFITFTKSYALFDITGTGSKLRVVFSNFNQNISVDFQSLPTGTGCCRTFTGESEEDMRVLGECNGESIWIISPQTSNSQLYLTVLPNNVPAQISNLAKTSESTISVNSSAEPFVVSYGVKLGAFVKFQGKNFRMSYRTGKSQATVVEATVGTNLTITSPLYPGAYPQEGKFDYSVSTTGNPVTYLAIFKTLDLLPAHVLTMKDKSETKTISGQAPVGDFLVSSDLLKDIEFDASINQPATRKAYGFSFDLVPTSEGKLFTADKGSFSAKNCDKLRCIYIITIDRGHLTANESIAVNLTMSVVRSNTTNSTDPTMMVWDGESTLRSPSLVPLKNGSMYTFNSRSNSIIVSLQGSSAVNVSYVKSPCSFMTNTMCLRERMCAPLSWRCNNRIECSDGSDELNCHGGPPPPPLPPPEVSSSGWRNAFWICAPIFILLGAVLTKGVPMIVQKLRDSSRYQQFHDLGEH